MKSHLPVDDYLSEIGSRLQSHSSLIISAAPGAGKTTRVPPALLQFFQSSQVTAKKILVLEPRRVAALAAATRIAEENNWTLGKEVGYQVRFENKTQPDTQLIFLTEALLAKKISQDPELKDVGCVILDEFHERSIHVDLALGLLKELQSLSREDLKIIVMSATLEAQKLSQYLELNGKSAPVIQVPGKTFPLEVNLGTESQLLQTNYQFIDRVVDTVKAAWMTSKTKKDILVFLPGTGEIARTEEKLTDWANRENILLHPLHGNLSLSDQKQILKPGDQPRVILATNIAESSLTLNGIDTVVDTGLARRMIFHSQTGLSKMETVRISKASATQRAGRASRQYPGRVFRLWSKMDELSMPDFDTAEIHRTDLVDALLTLAGQGIIDFQSFSWFEKPQDPRLQLGIFQLQSWDCLDQGNNLTAVGKKVLKIPLHPRLGCLFLAACNMGQSRLGAEICTLLAEKDILLQPWPSNIECDLQIRLDYFQENRQRFSHLHQITDHIMKLAPAGSVQQSSLSRPEAIQFLILAAYKDRLCRRRRPNDSSAVMMSGKGVQLSEKSLVKTAEFFVALDLIDGLSSSEAIVSKASAISKEKIGSLFNSKAEKISKIFYDSKTEKILKLEYKQFQGLPLEDAKQVPLTTEEAQDHLSEIVLARWEEVLRKNESLNSWIERLVYYQHQMKSELDLPAIQKKALQTACFGEKNIEAVWNKDLIYFFEAELPADFISHFHKSCPSHLEVPTGTRCRLRYSLDKDPHIEVRLQEVFGWKDTPTIFQGKIKVTLHLLAPNYRPVQVTQDLASFWKNGYPEVRKELRSRYPKHSWPDDPLTAPPQAKGRPRQN